MNDDGINDFIKRAAALTPESQKKYDEFRGRRGKELELWHAWDAAGRQPEMAAPLLQSMTPIIKREATKRMAGLGGSIPRAALEGELRTAAIKSLHSYEPSRGVALSTHVTNGFQRISDFVNANRNAKYMPGEDVKQYNRFRNASDELHDELGRSPTHEELRERLPDWSPKTIQKMQRGFGKELFTDMGDGLSPNDEHPVLSPRDAFQLVRSQLKPQEVAFGHHFFVPEGEKQPSIKAIARTLGIPDSRAYRLKAIVESRAGAVRRKE